MRTNTKTIHQVLRNLLIGFAILFSLSLQAVQAQSAPEYLRTILPDARLQGSGNFTWFGLKIYSAELWSEKAVVIPNQFTTSSFALDLHYARTLHGEKIAIASIDEIKKLGIGNPAKHAAWLASMKSLFPDVEKGTHLTGIYAPGKATQFFRDGQLIGEISDPEFGPAFFAIWLDAKTSEPKLRKSLLGIK